ncbi:MAG: hypothetical protein ACYC3X_22625 [Pirellulaceae bacterium]
MASTLKSDATREDKSWKPPTNPVPPAARPRKATSPEMDQRIGYTAQMILDGRRKHEIKRFFASQYGIDFRQVERYIRLARARLAEANGTDVDQMRAEFYARYLVIYRTAENDAIKISALRAASDLFGLNAPIKTARTTASGTDVHLIREAVRGLTIDELRTLRGLRDRLRQNANSDDGYQD